jgi:hypothetical protein
MKITRLFATTFLILAPTFAYSDEMPKEKAKSIAYVRILHAITGAPGADFYFDDQKVSEKISFKTLTDYFEVPSGKTTIKMTAAGKDAMLLDGRTTFSRDGYYTIAPFGTMDKAKLTVQNDLTSKSDEHQARLHVFHLSPGVSKLSFAFIVGEKPSIIKDLEYGEDTTRLIKPGTIMVQVGIGNKVLYEVPNIQLEAGKCYALFAVGKLNLPGPQAFELIIQTMGRDEKM